MNAEHGLTLEGCRVRQQRVRSVLARLGLDAALLTDPRHVRYLTGYWCRSLFRPIIWLSAAGPTVLVAPLQPSEPTAADEVVIYPSLVHGTLVDQQLSVACEQLRSRMQSGIKVGCDGSVPFSLLKAATWHDLTPELLTLRRSKDADEVQAMRRSAAAAEAAYRYVRTTLVPGITEVDLFAGMHGASVLAAGEPIGEYGNDFQIGALGSAPRHRAAEAGEIAILDVSVDLRGYASDMCCSFVVGGKPTPAQSAAHQRLLEVMQHLEATIKPGVSCRAIDTAAKNMLSDFGDAVFQHHLGHGVGLCHHEGPRIDASSNDTFQAGDVFAIEPGLYAPELRAGLRIEHLYWLGPEGLERLTTFSTELA